MGILLSRWRKKPSTTEVLDAISEEIREINEFKRDTDAWHKKLISWLLAYFSAIYLIAAAVAYFRYLGHADYQDFLSQFKLLLPFIIAPLIFFLLKKVLTWWYHRKIRKNETQLQELTKKRTKILNEVMETETYKVAKEILEKYAPDQLVKSSAASSRNRGTPQKALQSGSDKSTPSGALALTNRPQGEAASGANMELRRRLNASTAASPRLMGGNPNAGGAKASGNMATTPTHAAAKPQHPLGRTGTPPWRTAAAAAAASGGDPGELVPAGGPRRPPGPPLPRPVFPRDRSFMDRAVEYLVGDGPSNRYALICKQCQSHNGMALREEFEYIAYRCAYCFYWNPARKQRPVAPKLQPMVLQPSSQEERSSSSSEDEAILKPAAVQQQRDTSSDVKTEEDESEREDRKEVGPAAVAATTTAEAKAPPRNDITAKDESGVDD